MYCYVLIWANASANAFVVAHLHTAICLMYAMLVSCLGTYTQHVCYVHLMSRQAVAK